MKLVSGTYIVAVSGGVDSVVLLNMLSKRADLQLVVAHFDHGIRSDSEKDRQFVKDLSKQYGYPFEYLAGRLGPQASEELARKARYEFLEKVHRKYQAKAVLTAHHQDDVLETILLNLLRGTGRKGLTSLADTKTIIRPLLPYSKQQLVDYATEHDLHWREDSTNTDTRYLRNWVRLQLMPKLTPQKREQLVAGHTKLAQLNQNIDSALDMFIGSELTQLNKEPVVMLPTQLAQELVAHWLRSNNLRQFDKKTISRVVVAARTLPQGKTIDIYKGWRMVILDDALELQIGR